MSATPTRIASTLAFLGNLFPLWILAAAGLAFLRPEWFVWFHGPFIVWGLAVIMLAMGATLNVSDFKTVLALPKAVALGFAAQYSIMPFLGWSLARAFALPDAAAAGLILIACCPGGTASNVITYLARANLPLSVVMTTASTFGAVLMTPLLTHWLAGTHVPVDAWGLFWSTTQVVLLPVIAGLALHHLTPRLTEAVLPAAPLISGWMVALICAGVVARNLETLRQTGPLLLAAVASLHTGGFALGYLFMKLFRYDRSACRTVSIEVGMQNSGLGVVLAQRHFPDPLSAVPGAIASVLQSLIGSLLAALWRFKTPPNDQNDEYPMTKIQSHPHSRLFRRS